MALQSRGIYNLAPSLWDNWKPARLNRTLSDVIWRRFYFRDVAWGEVGGRLEAFDLPVITINTFFSLSGIDSYIYDGSQGDDYSDEDDY